MPDTRSPAAPTAPFGILRRTLADAGHHALAQSPELEGWLAQTAALVAGSPAAQRDGILGALATGARWAAAVEDLRRRPRAQWAEALLGESGVRRLGAEGVAHLVAACGTAEDLTVRVAARETRLAVLLRTPTAALRALIADDTEYALAALDALRDLPTTEAARHVRGAFPALAALATAADTAAAIEHDPGPTSCRPQPLLDHAGRVLGRRLRALELGDLARFQDRAGLSPRAFQREVARWRAVAGTPLASAVRLALMHLDVAKGGEVALRAAWGAAGIDLSVHNTAAARLLDDRVSPAEWGGSALTAVPQVAALPVLRDVVLALVEGHGVTGQIVRGEMPLRSLAPFLEAIERLGPSLGAALGIDEAAACALLRESMHLINLCDTAAVREGLMTDELLAQFDAVEARIGTAQTSPHPGAPAQRLHAIELAAWHPRGTQTHPALLLRLSDRLARLRAGRVRTGEAPDAGREVLAHLDGDTLARLAALMDRCQLWYAEAGTSALSPEAQLKVLVIGMTHAAAMTDQRAKEQLFHLTCLPLVAPLGTPGDPAVPYRVRLVETLLAPHSIESLLAGATLDEAASPLGSVRAEIGGGDAAAITFRESEETRALLTLLPIYERKNAVAFHATLKALCDVYGLRKDEFDRVANEEQYLAHMNSARSDKERMLDYVRPGSIVEVGPGGGVVLDLCEQRFPTSTIVGIDASQMVADALRRRQAAEGHRWDIRHADAFQLPALVGSGTMDTVIFCSLLHEIYSYVPYADGTAPVRRFHLHAVRDLLRAAYTTLAPGGRLVIRDGVMPAPGERLLELVAPDAADFFRLFVKQFEGRAVHAEWVTPTRVRLSAADAMEFCYTYIWGPESFPYEVREQYGVLPYDAYRDAIVGWLAEVGPTPTVVPIPRHEAEYTQAGYRRGLAGKVALYDGEGAPCELPASNALWVFEKPAVTV